MTDEGIITYEKLYEVLRLEKYKKELQKLELDFYNKIVRYLDEKKAILESQESKADSVFASQSSAKTKRQLENTRMILKEIYERRESKIVQIAMFNSRTGEKGQELECLLDEERAFYTSLIDLFNLYRNGMLGNLLIGKLPEVKAQQTLVSAEYKPLEKMNKLLRFLHAVPKFIGEDMQNYGPFESEEVAHLPEKVSEILIKNNRAEEI